MCVNVWIYEQKDRIKIDGIFHRQNENILCSGDCDNQHRKEQI